jgi:3-dehydroquinate synthase
MTLHIQWEIKPPHPELAPFVWPKSLILGDESPDTLLEEKLSWPHKTLAILRIAFSLNIETKAPWLAPHSENYKFAQSIYKRGLPWLGGKQKGNYPIVFSPWTRGDHFTVMDANLAPCYPSLSAFYLSIGENVKNIQTLAHLMGAWKEQGSPNHWQIVGGGCLTDLAGFAADLVGATFELIPTTLLGMVDASIGGKTGINFEPYGKNQIGRFAFPEKVWIDPSWWKSLPTEDWKAGGNECLKHSFLQENHDLVHLTQKGIRDSHFDLMADILPQLIQVKASLISQDPLELGPRAFLNFGHTLAHMLEGASFSQLIPDISHGYAVGIGLIYAIHLSVLAGLLDQKVASWMIDRVILSESLPPLKSLFYLGDPDLWAQMAPWLSQDKKNRQGSPRWVLLKAMGSPILTSVDPDLCLRAWEDLRTIIGNGE